VYHILPPELGQTQQIRYFAANNATLLTVEATVRPEKESIEVGGKTYEVFVVDVPALREVDYVTEEGDLLRLELPAQGTVFERIEP
jgi:hypothetical protein